LKPTPTSSGQATKGGQIVDSLLKMVIAMAIDVYGYDPEDQNSTTVADIEAALDNCGLKVSEKVIRLALQEGTLLLPRNRTHQDL
jgi:hypothetical protein